MTEYELHVQEILTATSLASLDSFGYYLTILASYLVAGYLAGSKLSTLQTLTISILFVFGAIVTAYTSFSYMSRAVELADVLESLHPGRFYGGQPSARNGLFGLQIAGIIASLKFMWDIRHPKE